MNNMEYVKVAVLDNAFEASLVEQIMTDQQIPYIIKSYEDEVYGTLFQLTRGWAAILAPKSYKEQVMTIVQDVRASQVTEAGNREEE
jgi:hypothetical protein